MSRIFLTLASLSTVILAAAFVLGLNIGDATLRDAAVQGAVSTHFLTSLGALVFAALVHAIVLTYFMGTSRWMEETCRTYELGDESLAENRALKYRTIPAMAGCLLLLVLTGAFGAAADPASAVGFQGWAGLSAGTIHFLAAAATLGVNLLVNLMEFYAIQRNGELIEGVLGEVRRIREERGLPV